MKPAFEKAKRLRLQARERLAAQKLEEALQALDEAVATLKELVPEPSSDLYRDLAETYGMRGGILRRLRRRPEAIESYLEGARYEQDEEFGSEDTYNLVNSVVLPLYDRPELLD